MELSGSDYGALIGVIGTLTGVALGWGLTQITEHRRNKQVLNQKKGAIKTELKDLLSGLDTSISLAKKECEKFALNEPGRFVTRPTPINIPISNLYYPEVVSALTEAERRNLKSVFDFIQRVNTSIANLTYGDQGGNSWSKSFDLRWLVYLYTAILKTLIEEVIEHFDKKIVSFEDARIKSTKQEIEHFKSTIRPQN